ncbi:MAG TPA: sigma-70 family RNA polymerase sigma factor [Gammaproteobacteria bacterium]|nr:sigma-70 family RNA polymerase sigma factor [Gammaproteobacteria bacterium]
MGDVKDDELTLFGRLQRGDVEALAGLYYRYEGRISRFLSRMGLAEHERAAVINDTMFTVWKSAQRFDPARSRLSTWIFGIARNKCRKAFEASRPVGNVDPEALDNVMEWHDDIESLETRQWLSVGLAALPDEQRMVLELTFLEGLSYAEIAEILDCPVNTVKTRVFHARRKLRAMLPEDRIRNRLNEEVMHERS